MHKNEILSHPDSKYDYNSVTSDLNQIWRLFFLSCLSVSISLGTVTEPLASALGDHVLNETEVAFHFKVQQGKENEQERRT